MKSNTTLAAVMVGLLVALILSRITTPPESTVIEQPKQNHHVIYISVCGTIEGVILTTDPLQYADWKTPMTQEMIDLETEALLAKRVFSFGAGLGVVCSDLERMQREVH